VKTIVFYVHRFPRGYTNLSQIRWSANALESLAALASRGTVIALKSIHPTN
jgi:hypothetical protein